MGDIGAILDEYDVWGAIGTTIALSVLSTIGALILGTVLAVLRVSPVAVLRGLGTSYVNVFRNTPLTVLMVISVLGAMILGFSFSDLASENAFRAAVVMLSLYHGAFVCEALRSGINTVSLGQAEAARSIGLNFGQTLREVVFPQAVRGAIVPLGSAIIALIKNTTVAAVIGVGDSAGLLETITENEGSSLWVFFLFSMVFVILTLPIGLWTTHLSKKLAVKR